MNLHVMSSLAIKEAYLDLLQPFQQKSGVQVRTEWRGMADIKQRVAAGENPDLVIASQKTVREIQATGKVAQVVDLARSGVAVAVKKGAARPDISSAEAVKRALRAAKSIGYSSGPSGVYLAELFQKWGIGEELARKSTQTPPGTGVGPLIARGEVEIGFQQMSELLPTAGIDILGPLPPDLQIITTFSGGVHVAARNAEAARAWVTFLTSREAAPVLRKHGMEPA